MNESKQTNAQIQYNEINFRRRSVLRTLAGSVLLSVTGSTLAKQCEITSPEILSPRYPDPLIEVSDPSFNKYRLYSSSVERLATGFRWAEGPVWFGDGQYLLFSDIPNNRIMRYDNITGQTAVFRENANYSNGLAHDKQGRLLACEHLTRRLTRTEYDGSVTVLADSFEGKPLNSPNDIAVQSNGAIWFTDPTFGINGYYEGEKAKAEQPTAVYRIDPQTEKLERVLDDLLMPNGIAVDEDGNIWAGWGSINNSQNGLSGDMDGVIVINPQGKQIAHIHLPERCANLCFGGSKRNRVFMASGHSLYALYVETRGT
ncbi:SMP-30/gluconolactonase/LRE family protein [Basfia succiniciproducens]|uniref:SMP-30/gluconolactonase/LRE family protein n=1 Tax=Basfia succiniciproducens TaxID=653940 RepID=UPI003FCD601D